MCVRLAFLGVNLEVQLLLHAESETCSRADFLNVDFIEPDVFEAGALQTPGDRSLKIAA